MSSATETKAPKQLKLGTAAGIILIHLGALAACFPYFFTWSGLFLFVAMVWLTASLGVSLGFHRLLTHRTWHAKPWLRIVLSALGSLSLQEGPISWSATHRLHHREADHEDDPHSPLVSFGWAHYGWLIYVNPLLDDAGMRRLVPDLYAERSLRFLERYAVGLWALSGLLALAIGIAAGGLRLGLSLLVWGTLVRTVWVWHSTWSVNSFTHLFGYRNYAVPNDSRNLWWVALTTFGEGWHNNHHALAGTADFGHKWFELDPTYWVLTGLERLGWAERIHRSKRIKQGGPPLKISDRITATSPALPSRLTASRHRESSTWRGRRPPPYGTQ